MFNTHKQGLLKETIRGILLEFVSNKCPNCGIQGKEGKKFCSQCGTKMGICPHEGCGAPLNEKPTQKFCSKCGGKLPITEADTTPGKDNASDNAEKKIKSVLDNSEMMRQAASRAFEKSNQLFIAISKRQKVYHNLYNATRDKDKDRAESLKKELSAINQEIIKAATEDVDSYREFLSTVEADGGQVPDNLKKSIEDKIENFRSQHAEDDERIKNLELSIDNAEKKLEKMDDPAEQEKEYIKWAKKSMIARDGTEFGAYIGAASAFFTNTGKEDLASKLGNKLQKMRSDSASEKRGLVMTKEQANQLLSSLGLNNWILEGNNRTAAGINWRNNMKIRLSELKRIIREEVEALTEAAPAGGITLQSKGHPNNINILTDTESRLWRVDPKNRKSLGLTADDIKAQMGGKDSMSLEDFSDDVQDAVHAVWDMLEPSPRTPAEYPRAEYDPSLEFSRDYGTGRHMVTDPEGNPIPGAYARPSKWREPRRMWGKGT